MELEVHSPIRLRIVHRDRVIFSLYLSLVVHRQCKTGVVTRWQTSALEVPDASLDEVIATSEWQFFFLFVFLQFLQPKWFIHVKIDYDWSFLKTITYTDLWWRYHIIRSYVIIAAEEISLSDKNQSIIESWGFLEL